MIQGFKKVESVRGEINLGGDKSISHRAVMFAAMAQGESKIYNCSASEDVTSTVNCFEKLGCRFERSDDFIRVEGKGFKSFSAPSSELYAGNSGTTTRLISGILCAQNFESIITGDDSLSLRPMRRIVDPLRLMGGNISAGENGTLPLRILPSEKIKNINYRLQVASAQVKSALLLCALHHDDESIIIDPWATRNHTEKMLGIKTEKSIEGTYIYVSKKNYPRSFEFTVPSDISSAAFFVVLALLTKNSEVVIKNVSLNETRTGILTVLKSMGGQITTENFRVDNGEEVGDIRIVSSQLHNIDIPPELIPNIIDEIPVLSVAGIFAHGNFKISKAKELRVKESDRIKSLCDNFRRLGLNVNEFEDGFELSGKISTRQILFESFGDHRIAMASAILSMLIDNGGKVNGFECVGISNPNFLKQVASLL